MIIFWFLRFTMRPYFCINLSSKNLHTIVQCRTRYFYACCPVCMLSQHVWSSTEWNARIVSPEFQVANVSPQKIKGWRRQMGLSVYTFPGWGTPSIFHRCDSLPLGSRLSVKSHGDGDWEAHTTRAHGRGNIDCACAIQKKIQSLHCTSWIGLLIFIILL